MNQIIINSIFILSAACAGGLLSNSAHASASSVPGSSDLVGQVTNHNGLRDDINEYILATFADDPKKQTAATRFAQANQRMLKVIAENKPVTQDLVTKISYAGQCFAQNMDKKIFTKQARELTARTFNTEARFRAHDEFSRQAHGMSVATSDNLDACEAAK
jgi:chemotaxis regulatin CheY-phosphate phosphatase CheZ